MHAEERIDGLEFYDYAFIHQKIEPIRILNQQLFVANRTKFLLLERQTSKTKFMSECLLISTLK